MLTSSTIVNTTEWVNGGTRPETPMIYLRSQSYFMHLPYFHLILFISSPVKFPCSADKEIEFYK